MQTRLHRNAFTQEIEICFSFGRFNLISCERGRDLVGISTQFLVIEPHLVRKGYAKQLEIGILPPFLTIEPDFVRKSCTDQFEIALLPQFLAIEPHSVQYEKMRGTTWTSYF
jgi:hypothetical protein